MQGERDKLKNLQKINFNLLYSLYRSLCQRVGNAMDKIICRAIAHILILLSFIALISIAPTAVAGMLSASPNPCIANTGSNCTTTLSWNSATNEQVWVQTDGNPNSGYFACGGNWSQQANWIQPGHSYAFSLYQANSCAASDRVGTALDTVTVQGLPFITGDPAMPGSNGTAAPCRVDQSGVCTANITWNYYSNAEVFLQVDNGTAFKLFSCGTSGTQAAAWIEAGHTYKFSVFPAPATSCPDTPPTGTALGSYSVVGTTNGVCGTSDELATSVAPTKDLCASGTATKVSGEGPWMWSCNGTGGGTPSFCVAPSEKIFAPQTYSGNVAGCTWESGHDVAPCLQAAIKNAAAVGGTVSVPAGTWLLKEPLSLLSNVTLEGTGTATTTLEPMAGNIGAAVLAAGGSISNVLVKKITFDGGGSNFSNSNSVIAVTTGSNIMFDDIAVQNTHGIGMILQGGMSNSGVRNSSFTNIGNLWVTTLQRSDRIQGLVFCCGITNTNNFAIGNSFTHIGLDALQPANQNGFTAMYNTFDLANGQTQLLPSPDYPAGIFPLSSTNVMIGYNTIAGAQGNAIDAPALQNSKIFNNTITNPGQSGIGLFLGYDGITQSMNDAVTDNQISSRSSIGGSCFTGGITLGSGTPSYITIANNTIETAGYGIQFVSTCDISTNANNVTIENNSLSGNALGPIDGFFQYCTQNCSLIGNQ